MNGLKIEHRSSIRTVNEVKVQICKLHGTFLSSNSHERSFLSEFGLGDRDILDQSVIHITLFLSIVNPNERLPMRNIQIRERQVDQIDCRVRVLFLVLEHVQVKDSKLLAFAILGDCLKTGCDGSFCLDIKCERVGWGLSNCHGVIFYSDSGRREC